MRERIYLTVPGQATRQPVDYTAFLIDELGGDWPSRRGASRDLNRPSGCRLQERSQGTGKGDRHICLSPLPGSCMKSIHRAEEYRSGGTQLALQDLPRRAPRQTLTDLDRPGILEGGKLLVEPGQQVRLGRRRPGPRHDERLDLFPEPLVRHADYRRERDGRMGHDDLLQLAR